MTGSASWEPYVEKLNIHIMLPMHPISSVKMLQLGKATPDMPTRLEQETGPVRVY
jgi:hypothetical protein